MLANNTAVANIEPRRILQAIDVPSYTKIVATSLIAADDAACYAIAA